MAKKGDWYVATTSGTAEVDGSPIFFEKDKTRVRVGDPITKLEGWESMFAPLEEGGAPDIEQATAAPGEKRGEAKKS